MDIRPWIQTSLGISRRAQGLAREIAGSSSFASSTTKVRCDREQSWKTYPWVTHHSLHLLMAEVDYGIQVKVSVQRGLGEGSAVC